MSSIPDKVSSEQLRSLLNVPSEEECTDSDDRTIFTPIGEFTPEDILFIAQEFKHKLFASCPTPLAYKALIIELLFAMRVNSEQVALESDNPHSAIYGVNAGQLYSVETLMKSIDFGEDDFFVR